MLPESYETQLLDFLLGDYPSNVEDTVCWLTLAGAKKKVCVLAQGLPVHNK